MKKNLLLSICWLFISVISSAQIITTIAGNGIAGYMGDGGPSTAAELNLPDASYALAGTGNMIAVSSGNIYIADQGNNHIRKIDPAGIITNFAGNGLSAGWSGDGGPATAAELDHGPFGIAADAAGNVYIADGPTNLVRKVDPSGIITTIAGSGLGPWGYTGDGGPATAAELNYPEGVAVDGAGNVYIADLGNAVVRKIDASGIITTIAGNGTPGFSGDGGPATAAKIGYQYGIAADNAGNVYIADAISNRIRKVNTTGIITTIAGNDTTTGFSGDGGPATAAQLYYPQGVAVDDTGNVFIPDVYNNRIRKINTTGIITTIAGCSLGGNSSGFSGDDGSSLTAKLKQPMSVAVDGNGNIYVVDEDNERIRKISPGVACVYSLAGISAKIKLFPNPATTILTITATDNINLIVIFNLLGQVVYTNTYHSEHVEINIADLPSGIFFVKVNSTVSGKFLKG